MCSVACGWLWLAEQCNRLVCNTVIFVELKSKQWLVQEDAPPESVLSVLDGEVQAERWVDTKLQQQRQADRNAAAASAAAFQQVSQLLLTQPAIELM